MSNKNENESTEVAQMKARVRALLQEVLESESVSESMKVKILNAALRELDTNQRIDQ